LGIGDWGLGIGPIPNPQSPPIPNDFFLKIPNQLKIKKISEKGLLPIFYISLIQHI
jgi:hypothetical protein